MALVRFITVLLILCPLVLFSQESAMTEAEFKDGVAFMGRISANKPFLKDSSDVLLEPKSLNTFFTDKIYQRLEGNSYFGYRWDEGFTCDKREVSIEEIRDLTGTTADAYRLALTQALAEYQIKPDAVCRIGAAIVGVHDKETERTLPGVMVEAYLLNTSTRKSFFMRYGAGSPRGLAAALRLSAEMLVAELEGRYEQPRD